MHDPTRGDYVLEKKFISNYKIQQINFIKNFNTCFKLYLKI